MKSIAYLFVLNFIFFQGFGQRLKDDVYKITSLDSILLKYTDSIYVFEVGFNLGLNNTSIFYLTKKDKTVNLFEYGIDYSSAIKLPPNMRDIFSPRILDYSRARYRRKFDQFFKLKNISDAEARTLWESLGTFKPNELIDDIKGGYGCDSITFIGSKDGMIMPIEIFDAEWLTLTLLTKDQLKSFYFYAPKFYLEQCPIKRDSRRRILEIQKLFGKYASF